MANGKWSQCCRCKVDMWIPAELEQAAQRGAGHVSMYCAYGHGQVYAVGESVEQKLRRERDRLAQQVAQRDDEIKHQSELRAAAQRQLRAQRGIVTRIKNRVGHGVCPCCNRTFSDLQRHMKSKHGDYAKSDIILQAAE